VHYRMGLSAVDIGPWPFGVRPIGLVDQPPPRRGRHALRGWEVVGQQPGEDEGGSEALGLGDIAGLCDEGGEVRIRHRAGVDPEAGQGDIAGRPFAILAVAEGIFASHEESPAVEADHRGCRGRHRGARNGARPLVVAACAVYRWSAAAIVAHRGEHLTTGGAGFSA
jgi:hypothetical protein